MVRFLKHGRGLLAVLAVLAIAVAACSSGGGSKPPAASQSGRASQDTGNGNGTGLTAGLSGNLDKLDSYKFTYSVAAGSITAIGSGSSLQITGTVINKPVKSALVNTMGVQTMVIGDESWTSMDGTTWYVGDTTFEELSLPTKSYSSWFDTGAGDYKVVGDETKNGVACVHFKGDEALAQRYSTLGVTADFRAEMWVAKDGNYPVSGIFSFTATTEGETGAYGMTFDVTNVNDAANKLEAPTNVVGD